MPRLIKKTAHAPIKVGDKYICMCGLSKDQPFCDKSHLQTVGEDEKKLYWYNNGKREVITQEADGCCEDGCCGGNCSGENETEE